MTSTPGLAGQPATPAASSVHPEAIAIHGKVLRGAQGCPGKLTFHLAGGDTKDVATDERGAYEVSLAHPATMVTIALDEAYSKPDRQVLDPPISDSGEHNLRVPNIRLRVRVVNQKTGHGVPRARVRSVNAYAVKEGGRGAASARAVDATTDASGQADLLLTGPGTLEVFARALGYLQPTPTHVLLATDPTAHDGERLEIGLLPDEVTVRMLLPDGEAAPLAGVLVAADLAAGAASLQITSDLAGVVSIPRHLEGVLVVKHPAAGFAATPWHPRGGDDEEVQLAEPAAMPLRIRVTDAEGVAVPGAEVALWVEGQRLSGDVLTFVTGRLATTDGGGYWTAEGLPAARVAVLAWRPDSRARDLADRGKLDVHAVDVGLPWPPVVEVRLAE